MLFLFCFSFPAILLFFLMNALVYVDIDQRGFYICKEKSQIVGYEKLFLISYLTHLYIPLCNCTIYAIIVVGFRSLDKKQSCCLEVGIYYIVFV